MTEKFLKWFFSEVDMYGSDIKAGIFGNYVIDTILGTPYNHIDLFIYSDNSNEWKMIEESFIKHLQHVWNIFQNNKISIIKKDIFYSFNLYNIQYRIFCEKPYFRNVFTFETLQYIWKNQQFALITTHPSLDPLFLLRTINHVKKKKLMPLYTKYLTLDHNFFIADREHYFYIVEQTYNLLQNGWFYDNKSPSLHLTSYDTCSICMMEDKTLKLKLQCNHVFHMDCIKTLMLLTPEQEHCNKCPNCRSPIQIFYKL